MRPLNDPSSRTAFAGVAQVQVAETPGEIELTIARNAAETKAYFAIRHQVFVEEQQVFEESDVDRHDPDATHILALADGEPAGAVRCYHSGSGIWFGGRLAVAKEHRTSCNIGALLVRKAVEVMEERGDVKRFFATIQIQNVRFFKRLGWVTLGKPFMMNARKHQMMEKPLKKVAQ